MCLSPCCVCLCVCGRFYAFLTYAFCARPCLPSVPASAASDLRHGRPITCYFPVFERDTTRIFVCYIDNAHTRPFWLSLLLPTTRTPRFRTERTAGPVYRCVNGGREKASDEKRKREGARAQLFGSYPLRGRRRQT